MPPACPIESHAHATKIAGGDFPNAGCIIQHNSGAFGDREETSTSFVAVSVRLHGASPWHPVDKRVNHCAQFEPVFHFNFKSNTLMTDPSKEKLRPLLSKIQEFLRADVYPLEQDFLRLPFRALVPALNEKRQQVKVAGLWTPHLPKEYAGLV